ncbi:DUF2795 domain-containing protein [Blastococcus sp. MG754426]|uniref:DUF2795 domain-containing protein n=1 Tax=unclassified Blastococcus TaxID=2619396 RepID=UPI001EF0FDA1|nr:MULTISPECIES: DUF2795 domain-containing protein [unclassified Blastococcus]MCF6506962.1 DUF2795 domain-containing protein [Blastococcus sp. MG754426]MCF6511009.1 DUF2795 domain-containing protein [Blastococcus sp. MG754427]MCF6734411.1 DUF2795 domain-containing protein [Blastococcus sp. KM273129]
MTDPHQAATAPGTDQGSIERRAALAEALGKEVWPADREQLIAKAQEGGGTDRVLSDLQRLPAGRQFENVQEVAEALGLGTEQQRF